MFTGLIEKVAVVKNIRPVAGGMRLCAQMDELVSQIGIGDSIAVNGVCLSAVSINGSMVCFDVSAETLSKTTTGKLQTGNKVNIELSLNAGDRFGGHFVSGHIDGTARIADITREGNFWTFRFEADRSLLGQMVLKGSVAVDGISLTIAELEDRGFSVAVIPQTFEHTTLGNAKTGDLVNIEIDMIVKAVRRNLEQMISTNEKMTIEKLRELGF